MVYNFAMSRSPENNFEDQLAASFNNIGRSIAEVGGYMRIALGETARQIGGEPFEKAVSELAGHDLFLPDIAALALIEEYDPGATELFWEYTKQAQKAAFRQDWLNLGKTSLKRWAQLGNISR